MVFEFEPNPAFNFVTSFGAQFNIPVQDDSLIIPPDVGQGSIKKIDLSPDFKLLVHQYRLKEELILKRLPAATPTDLISILFHSNEQPISLSTGEKQVNPAKNTEFAVQIASTDLDSVTRFPANTDVYFTVVGIAAATLKSLLSLKTSNQVVETILSGAPGYLFYERMSPNWQKVLRQLTEAIDDNPLGRFYYRIRVEELLYLLFEKLLQRETVRHSPVNQADVDKLFLVRTAIVADLGQPPRLKHLAKMAGLSETKMKDLFRQMFGDSIYNYYQKARMDEAAFLLKQGGLSVADVGTQLGFLNLSHFSRLFEKHYGLKPKRYSFGG